MQKMKAWFTDGGELIGFIHPSEPVPPGTVAVTAPQGYELADRGDIVLEGGSARIDPARALARLKAAGIATLKTEAARRIDALAWRLERAREKQALGVAGESVQAVLAEREAIRLASNRLEAAVDAATDADAVRAVVFEIDHAVDVAETPSEWWIAVGQFKDRLGNDAAAIAASPHAVCQAAMKLLDDREYVDLKGPLVATFLGLLESTGQPAAVPQFPGSGPITRAKIAAILGAKPSDDERYKP